MAAAARKPSVTAPPAKPQTAVPPLADGSQLGRLELKLEELAHGRGGPVAEIAEALLDALSPDD